MSVQLIGDFTVNLETAHLIGMVAHTYNPSISGEKQMWFQEFKVICNKIRSLRPILGT